MTGSQPHSDPVLTEDLWQVLFTQAFLFATKYIHRLRWRGTFGGVMPDGDDAESIAAQAVTDFLQKPGVSIRALQRSVFLGHRGGATRTTTPNFLSLGDHDPRHGLHNWGIHLVAESGTHWVGVRARFSMLSR